MSAPTHRALSIAYVPRQQSTQPLTRLRAARHVGRRPDQSRELSELLIPSDMLPITRAPGHSDEFGVARNGLAHARGDPVRPVVYKHRFRKQLAEVWPVA